jgi:tetratricopeptide (TPR) repeat protein
VPAPTARVVPSAVLAKGSGRRAEGGLAGTDWPPQERPSAVVPSPDGQPAITPQATPDPLALSPGHLYELGLTTAAMSFHTAAIEAVRECTARAPDHAPAWRKLAELLRLAREDVEAEAADAAAERASAASTKWTNARDERTPARLEKAERKLHEDLQGRSPEEAARALRNGLISEPCDTAALRLLAQLEKLAGDEITSLSLLARALELCPDYVGARQNYAELLAERRAPAATAAQTALLVAREPRNAYYRHLHAHAMFHMGNLETTLHLMAGLLREDPGDPRYWLLYAQALHYMGRRDEAVQAFRQSLTLQPDLGEAYWGLADMKGSFITEPDIAAMRAQLAGDALESASRKFMLYSLAHALEHAGDFAGSFAAYDEATRLARDLYEQRPGHEQPDSAGREGMDRFDHGLRVRRLKSVFSRENLETKMARAPSTPNCDTPIFIVGMPRAGSTLTEQILSSHCQVEGTRELSLIGDITRELALSRLLVVPNAYPDCLLDLKPDQLAALGARYIECARDFRKSGRPYFIDKRPWNWLEVGLIHLILPQAKIIDIRREPMAACFGMFKQPIAGFCHDLASLGRYYNRYVDLMEYWQSVLPGRVHFVQYENLVENTETEIRRMLDYCGLPFEEGCLRFWETDRVVSTPSAGQVRRPIYRDALQQWRNFEPWLGPLKESLSQPLEA